MWIWGIYRGRRRPIPNLTEPPDPFLRTPLLRGRDLAMGQTKGGCHSPLRWQRSSLPRRHRKLQILIGLSPASYEALPQNTVRGISTPDVTLLEANRSTDAEYVDREALKRFPKTEALYGLKESLRAPRTGHRRVTQQQFEEAWEGTNVVLTSSRTYLRPVHPVNIQKSLPPVTSGYIAPGFVSHEEDWGVSSNNGQLPDHCHGTDFRFSCCAEAY